MRRMIGADSGEVLAVLSDDRDAARVDAVALAPCPRRGTRTLGGQRRRTSITVSPAAIRLPSLPCRAPWARPWRRRSPTKQPPPQRSPRRRAARVALPATLVWRAVAATQAFRMPRDARLPP